MATSLPSIDRPHQHWVAHIGLVACLHLDEAWVVVGKRVVQVKKCQSQVWSSSWVRDGDDVLYILHVDVQCLGLIVHLDIVIDSCLLVNPGFTFTLDTNLALHVGLIVGHCPAQYYHISKF